MSVGDKPLFHKKILKFIVCKFLWKRHSGTLLNSNLTSWKQYFIRYIFKILWKKKILDIIMQTCVVRSRKSIALKLLIVILVITFDCHSWITGLYILFNLKVILHQFWVKKNFPWKFNLEYGGTFTKLFMHVSSRNMFPTTRNLQICVHVYCPRHCCGDWLSFGCFVPMIADHDLVKKSFGPMIANHDLVKKR